MLYSGRSWTRVPLPLDGAWTGNPLTDIPVKDLAAHMSKYWPVWIRFAPTAPTILRRIETVTNRQHLPLASPLPV
jgi:hypothetical protein